MSRANKFIVVQPLAKEATTLTLPLNASQSILAAGAESNLNSLVSIGPRLGLSEKATESKKEALAVTISRVVSNHGTRELATKADAAATPLHRSASDFGRGDRLFPAAKGILSRPQQYELPTTRSCGEASFFDHGNADPMGPFLSSQSRASASAGEQSIPPPPTLRFDPSSITLITRVLSRPDQYLSAKQGGQVDQTSTTRFNLLALVRDVGPLEETSVGILINRKGEKGKSKPSFRSWIVLQDGRGGALLKVILWGECARVWAGSESKSGKGNGDTQDDMKGRSDVIADTTSLSEGFTTSSVKREDLWLPPILCERAVKTREEILYNYPGFAPRSELAMSSASVI